LGVRRISDEVVRREALRPNRERVLGKIPKTVRVVKVGQLAPACPQKTNEVADRGSRPDIMCSSTDNDGVLSGDRRKGKYEGCGKDKARD